MLDQVQVLEASLSHHYHYHCPGSSNNFLYSLAPRLGGLAFGEGGRGLARSRAGALLRSQGAAMYAISIYIYTEYSIYI